MLPRIPHKTNLAQEFSAPLEMFEFFQTVQKKICSTESIMKLTWPTKNSAPLEVVDDANDQYALPAGGDRLADVDVEARVVGIDPPGILVRPFGDQFAVQPDHHGAENTAEVQ